MPPPAPTPRYFDVLRFEFFRRNSFHFRRYTRASRESDVAAHATNKAPHAAATAAAMRRSCMVSIESAALHFCFYNKLCVTTAAQCSAGLRGWRESSQAVLFAPSLSACYKRVTL